MTRKGHKKMGRPTKEDGPKVPYDELEKLLVHGELVPCQDGENTTVSYPSYRELATRYGVSTSLIATYSKKHDCLRRRKEAQTLTAIKADQKVIEMRAQSEAVSRCDIVRIIDRYIVAFERDLVEGKVRTSNPADFNAMLRLREFVLGGADSRQEINASLSLESLQARHAQWLKTRNASPAASGRLVESELDIIDVKPLDVQSTESGKPANSTTGPFEAFYPHEMVLDDDSAGLESVPYCSPAEKLPPHPSTETDQEKVAVHFPAHRDKEGDDEADANGR